MTKTEILTAITELAKTGQVTRAEVIDAYQGGSNASEPITSANSSRIANILYTIGGLVVVAGIIFLVIQSWDKLSDAIQILVSLGSALVLYFSALLLFTNRTARPLSEVLFVLAGILLPVGIFVTLQKISPVGNLWIGQLIMAGLPAIMYFITYWVVRRPIVLFTSLLLGTWALTAFFGLMLDDLALEGELLARVWAYWAMALGAGHALLAFSFKDSRLQKLVSPLELLGAGAVLSSGFALTFIDETPWAAIYALLVTGIIYLSIYLKSRVMLFLGSLALMAYLIRITFDYFADSLGWPIALIIIGFFVIGIGYASVLINNRYIGKGSDNS